MKTCNFCCDFGDALINTRKHLSLKNSHMFPGIVVSVDEGFLSVTAVADTYEPNFQDEYVPIKFCPMCGRKF